MRASTPANSRQCRKFVDFVVDPMWGSKSVHSGSLCLGLRWVFRLFGFVQGSGSFRHKELLVRVQSNGFLAVTMSKGKGKSGALQQKFCQQKAGDTLKPHSGLLCLGVSRV